MDPLDGGHLVIVSGEEDILVSCPTSMPYVEATEESLETTFQSFEVVTIPQHHPGHHHCRIEQAWLPRKGIYGGNAYYLE